MSMFQKDSDLGRERNRPRKRLNPAAPFLDEDGRPVDEAVALFIFFFRIFRLIVIAVLFFYFPIWIVWNIPNYLALWRGEPGLTNFLTQTMVFFSLPMLWGLVRYSFNSSKATFGQGISLLLAGALTLVTLGFIAWDVTKLPEFFKLVHKKPEAWIIPGIVVTFLVAGSFLGMSFAKETPD